MRIIPSLILAAALLVSCGGPIDRKAVTEAVDRQLEAFPESRLQDLYKSFFQDRFGTGHIISDREGALKYITSELEGAGAISGPYTEPCGWEGNYVRVSLRAINDGLVSADGLTDALVKSAIPVTDEAITDWKKEWRAILSEIKSSHPGLPGLAEDSASLDSLLAAGQYACHHSEEYSLAYSPHYRIVRKELIKDLLKQTE